jgi:hypothetical protein
MPSAPSTRRKNGRKLRIRSVSPVSLWTGSATSATTTNRYTIGLSSRYWKSNSISRILITTCTAPSAAISTTTTATSHDQVVSRK